MAKNQRTYDHEYKVQAVKLAQEKENAFLEEASAFFAASRLRSAKTSE